MKANAIMVSNHTGIRYIGPKYKHINSHKKKVRAGDAIWHKMRKREEVAECISALHPLHTQGCVCREHAENEDYGGYVYVL